MLQIAPLSQALKNRRLRLGLSPQKVASRIGCTRQGYCRWEAGSRPGRVWIPMIAEFLGVSEPETWEMRGAQAVLEKPADG